MLVSLTSGLETPTGLGVQAQGMGPCLGTNLCLSNYSQEGGLHLPPTISHPSWVAVTLYTCHLLT